MLLTFMPHPPKSQSIMQYQEEQVQLPPHNSLLYMFKPRLKPTAFNYGQSLVVATSSKEVVGKRDI